ncbi:PAS domain-containing sensor histidine kinase [Marinomonas ostreistagni]|uniref:histidine kinase n=1 Tax=Marinomonas ostreistagni TaxID=359209 RepID=A0ABS0ZEQ6_9GAMM|nr:PAS domain-containing sensor histidine kinase [Marinomonas ostreistagni]MBJ7552130.1 PAS domain-containing sensor histidine kinase [Marinomonas ostreistagni]
MSEVQTPVSGFETVFRDSKDGLAIFKEGIFVDCNQSMLDLVGATKRDEFIGLTPFDFSPEFQHDGRLSAEKGMKYIDQCYEEGSVRFEWLHSNVRGEPFWCEVIITKMIMDGEVVVYTNWRDITEKKDLELKIAEQKETFETLFNESLDGLSVFDGQKYTDCNKAFVKMFGFASKEDVIGIHPSQVSPKYQPDGRTSKDAAQEVIKGALAQGVNNRFEWMHRKVDGTEFWTEVILTKVTLNGVDSIYAVIRDISEKKDLEFRLEQQKRTFETLFEESLDGMTIYDGKQYLDCNKAFVRMMGFDSKDDIIGLSPLAISPELQADGNTSFDKAITLNTEIIENGQAGFEWVHKKTDGTEFWTEILVTTIVLNGEEVFFTTTRDISEKKALELEIAEQKLTFETLFNESEDGLTFFDGEKYLDCNKAFLKLMGFEAKEDVIGLNPVALSPEFQPDGRPTTELFEAASEDVYGKGSTRCEWQHQKTDGTKFWTEIIVGMLSLNGKEVIYSITRDINEQKELELQIVEQNEQLNKSNNELEKTIANLEQAQDKLVESEKMASLGSLVAGVAHEINTPVGVGLVGITQFEEDHRHLSRRYQNGELTEQDLEEFLSSSQEIADIVKKNLDRTAQLVKSFKQIAVDQTSEEDRDINLKDYLEEVLYSLGSMVRKAGVSVTIECPDNVNVTTNPGLISQVFTNLIMNSLTHGFDQKESGNITIAVRDLGGCSLEIRYQDDGKGITEVNLPKIFDPFFTTNRGKGGTGLGLNVTYNIVTNALGGTITCLSEEGKGVEFLIGLNVKERAE